MNYQLTCPCGQTHSITVSQAGQSLACTCGKTLAIPTLRGLKELPTISSDANPATRAIDTPVRGRPSILIGILVAAFVVALPTAIFFARARLTMDTSISEENERKIAFDQLDAASPIMVSDAWSQYSSVALGPPSKPAFYYVEKKKRSYETGIVVAGAIAVLAGLSAGALSAGRRS